MSGNAGRADVVSGNAGRPGAIRTRRPTGDRGSVAIEYLGFLPVLLLVALAGVQLGLVAYAGVQAGTAARAAARTDNAAAGAASASDWLKPRIGLDEGADRVTATATVTVPSVLPGISFLDPVTRSATMPRD
ncbi:pilus assembly protein [Streptomyces sp. PTM05]|uniref:Pilus assembly protein n=1 Tax=Streptantibioticus parmotrematis TaxID=2873249 RepID=A0ABS7QLH7_9ACTN|nr:TadE/TadG family type IV pilus assembly protein [Streptantibioticus parmotrematis]MBY8884049.1 pilus assembly protein [Streptantibioticus parmotrematis]